MTQELLLESYLRQLRLPSFIQSYQALAQEAARTTLSYERYLLALATEEITSREAHRTEAGHSTSSLPGPQRTGRVRVEPCALSPQSTRAGTGSRRLHCRGFAGDPAGKPGAGKIACRQGHRVRFYNVAGLVNDLLKAQQDYQLSRLMTQICKHELIVLDELGFIPFTATGAQLLFQVCSALYERVAVIVTTNLPFVQWASIMGGDERMSAALLDRLTHRATILEFVGESYRLRQQLQRHEGKEVKAAAQTEA